MNSIHEILASAAFDSEETRGISSFVRRVLRDRDASPSNDPPRRVPPNATVLQFPSRRQTPSQMTMPVVLVPKQNRR